MSTGDFPESLSRAILVGIMLVGRLGISRRLPCKKKVNDSDETNKRTKPIITTPVKVEEVTTMTCKGVPSSEVAQSCRGHGHEVGESANVPTHSTPPQ